MAKTINTFADKVISGAHFLQEKASNRIPIKIDPRNPCLIKMRKHRQTSGRIHGFTLIEILVVLLIIGVMLASIVVKAFPDERQVLRQEADRLGLLLEQARDQAFISGRSIAWSAQNEGYTFWKLNAQRQWEPIAGDQNLRARQLPPPMSVTALFINQVKVPPAERLVFSPSGLNPSFVVTLAMHQQSLQLASDSLGRIQVHAP
mgnify:CR=1 FL=1